MASSDKTLLPVLIVPGIMSSGLEVRKSSVDDKHIGERVWLNPVALGLGKCRMGPSFSPTKRGDGCGETESGSESESESEEEDAGTKKAGADAEEEAMLKCKSTWLHHLSLDTDMCSERPGNEIRAIPGLEGVDFLTEVATIKVGASYVFGPIIKLLVNEGYVAGVNLDAAPYDWRIAPLIMEERDRYFTATMERIERMYSECDGTPVVLVCHSMGCKTSHYLLNFAREKKGREWIDRHVHTYMPLGAPHVGAPFPIACCFHGEVNPLLDPLLSTAERLVFGRSLGSAPWIMPTTLPSVERNAPPAIFCKREGTLAVEILATDENPLGDLRRLTTNKCGSREVLPFKIQIEYGDPKNRGQVSKITTRPSVLVNGGREEAQYFSLPYSTRFLFPTPSTILDGNSLKPLRFFFYERGAIRPCEIEPQNKFVKGLRLLDRDRYLRIGIHVAAKKAKKHGVLLALSSPLQLDTHELVKSGGEGITMSVPMVARVDTTLFKMEPKKEHRFVDMKIRVSWTPPPSIDNDDPNNPIASLPPFSATGPFAPVPCIHSTKGTDAETDPEYVPLSGQAIFRAERLDGIPRLTRKAYACDPLGPRDASSYDRPPVRRTYAIYGINVDTEVSRVCRRVKTYREDGTLEERILRPYFKVDKKTRLSTFGNFSSGHMLREGTLFEHPGTPQVDLRTGERILRCGDGTVPYYSLQQSQVWAKEVAADKTSEDTVHINEIEGAEHREMLSDKRFHKILVDYLTGIPLLDSPFC